MSWCKRIWADETGNTIVEFAVVTPVMLLLTLSLGDLAYQAYMQALLTGALQLAGRLATIQGANSGQIDANVLLQVRMGNGNAAWTTGYPLRRSFQNFASIKPEPFVDNNSNGVRDPSECYTDLNNNGTYDTNPSNLGANGMGNANDSVVYTASITYPRLFPVLFYHLGWGRMVTISSTTVLKNQPYSAQPTFTPPTICT